MKIERYEIHLEDELIYVSCRLRESEYINFSLDYLIRNVGLQTYAAQELYTKFHKGESFYHRNDYFGYLTNRDAVVWK